MAIESVYWREELARIRKSLLPTKNPKRFSVRQLCIVERDTMLGFFIVRRLIELGRVGSKTRHHRIKVYKNAPTKNVTWLNKYEFLENYNWKREQQELVPILTLANQFIHCAVSSLFRDETRNWSEFFVFSDYEQKKSIFRVPVAAIAAAFDLAIRDWPSGTLTTIYNKEKKDFELIYVDD